MSARRWSPANTEGLGLKRGGRQTACRHWRTAASSTQHSTAPTPQARCLITATLTHGIALTATAFGYWTGSGAGSGTLNPANIAENSITLAATVPDGVPDDSPVAVWVSEAEPVRVDV